MNDSDADTGLEENGQTADELPGDSAAETEPGPTGKVEADDASGAGAKEPWEPPTEQEHLELLDIRDKASMIVEQLQRTTAEFENYKKRQDREAPRARAAAVRGFIEGLLPVIDNFERAVESAESQDGDGEGLLD
ncbi:MAG: nucleotide exchange factor GrpE, partial [Planctomycetota bacterium]|nr:nucleotide exchange factor GrpE [Planctomycetota bacterium]